MIIGFGNNTVSSLAADITASQTTIQVMPGAGALFARLLTYDYANSSNTLKTYAKITLTDAKETVFEICHLTAVNDDMLTVVRAQEGTTAKGWSLNDVIANFATRGSENQFVQIEELQSGHYTSGIAGGAANALTIALPATYFVNGSTDWTLRTPLVIYPSQNNTGAATLQLTMGGRVLGTFPLYKGNKAQLAANDILKDVALVCLMDNTKTFFSVANPGAIYAGLGTAAFKDTVTSMTDETTGRIPVVGWEGLGGVAVTLADTDLISKSGVGGRFFRQVGGDSNHFGEYGSGVHLLYGSSGDNINTLTANVFVGSSGNLYVEWLSINKTTGAVTVQNIQKLYGPLNKPTADDVGALSVNGGVVTGNDSVVDVRQRTDNAAYYYRGTKQDGTPHFYLGQGSANSDEVSLFNNKLGSGISLVNGAVRVTGQINPSNIDNFDARYQKINTALKSANGWFKDTNTGMIFQWGTVTLNANPATATFPIAFPNSCLRVFATDVGDGNYGYGANPLSNTQARIYTPRVGAIASFLAIGY